MKKIIYALLLGSLLWTYQFQAQVTLQALEAGEDTKANINDVVLEIFSFDTTQGILGSQDINIYYTNGEGDFDGTSLKIHLKDGEYSDANDATLNINSGNFNGSGSITAKLIISGDGNFWVKKKDNGEVIDFGEFNVNLNGVTFKVILRSRGGWRATASYSDSRWFERDNCGYNYTPGSSYYTGTAYGEGVSTTSYADAYSKAQDDAYNKYLEQGQRYANNNADCTYNGGGNDGGGTTYKYYMSRSSATVSWTVGCFNGNTGESHTGYGDASSYSVTEEVSRYEYENDIYPSSLDSGVNTASDSAKAAAQIDCRSKVGDLGPLEEDEFWYTTESSSIYGGHLSKWKN